MTRAPTRQSAVLARLKTLLAEDMDLSLSRDEIKDDISLLDEGLALDSIAVVEFIDLVEERFDVHLEEDALTGDRFSSLEAFARFIEGLMPGAET